MSEPRATQQIREWGRQRIADGGAVKLPELADLGVEHFVTDTALIKRLFGQQLRALIYDQLQSVFKATRPGAVLYGDEMLDEAEAAKRSEALRRKWGQWRERAGDQHVVLMSMNRPQLLMAAVERESRGDEEYKRASLFRELAEGLRGRQTVEQKFKPEEIEAIWRRIDGTKKLEEAA